jgi:hypothetical protein
MTFKAYMQNIQTKSGKTPNGIYQEAVKLGFIKDNKIIATHTQMLSWLKQEVGLGHVHANMVITYFKLRTHDPKLSEQMKTWAYSTGYSDSV